MTSHLAYIGDRHALLAACRDLIEAAEHGIILQMYLFASDGDQTMMRRRPGSFAYAETIAGWLIAKKQAHPGVSIVVVLDTNTPSNPALTRRRGTLVRQRLQRAGVVVLNACLFGNRFERRRRRLPAMNFHLDHQRVGLADWVEHQNRWQSLQNLEDHRKNLVIDGGRAGALTSHNFFDAAFDWHENLLWVTGDVARQLWVCATTAVTTALTIPQAIDDQQRAELRRLLDSPAPASAPPLAPTLAPVAGYPVGRLPAAPGALIADATCALVENEAIRTRLDELLAASGQGDRLVVATTYFSDLPTLTALAAAARRGARVQVLVDSLDALPMPAAASWLIRHLVNHQVLTAAARLVAELPPRPAPTGVTEPIAPTGSFELRVHDSRAGAMMHLKMIARLGPRPRLLGGQANYTPNSFSGAWLETDLEASAPGLVDAFAAHFDQLWDLPDSRPRPPSHKRWHDLGARALSACLALFDRLGLRP